VGFNWMKEIDLTDVDYQGFDIVTDLILDNRKNMGKRISVLINWI
jgi:hypothetical protein